MFKRGKRKRSQKSGFVRLQRPRHRAFGGLSRRAAAVPQSDVRRGGFPTSLTLRRPTGFPDRMLVPLRFFSYPTITTVAAGVAGMQVYRGNSLFDPDLTGTGVQPLGFKYWDQVYNTYAVRASKISLSAAPTGTVTNAGTRIGCYSTPTSGTALASDPTALASQIGERHIHLRANPDSRVITNYNTTGQVLGLSSWQDVSMTSHLVAAVGSNPTTPWFWKVYAFAIDASSINGSDLMVEITYYVEFIGRGELNDT